MATKKTEIKPMAHQATSLKFMDKNDIMFDMSCPGTGKTFVQIMAFAKRYKKTKKSALVLAPKSLLKAAWGNDITKFAPELTYSLAYAENREEAFAVDAHIYITNTDAVNWLVKQPKKFFDRFDTLIIDEVSSFKHATSGRSKALNKIKKYFKYRSVLSGTPNSNTICDIWNPVNVLDDGKRLGGSFFGFRSAVCTPKQVGPRTEMIKWIDKDGAEEVVFGQLSDITVRHKFTDCIDIPETHEYTLNYTMPPKQFKTYLAMQKTAIAELNAQAKITAINAAAVRTKLLQIASGAVYEHTEKYHLVDSGRYEMVMDLVEERKHPIVFFLWKHQRDNLVAMAEKRGLKYCVFDGGASSKEREEMEQYYQNGWYDVFFAHPKSAAHGLTLTRGTTIIWPSPPDDAEWFAQANKRQARAGQKEKTEIITILAEGTVEMKAFENLSVKTSRMNNLLDLFAL
jgi:SNF2 family DNA or RNA helicase